jgi:dipeptidyl aminopeptidase/acylaminoacyl peptidase
MRRPFSTALAAALALLAAPPRARAARPFTPEELLQTRRIDDVQVSPDGKLAAFTVRQKSLDENRDLKNIWLLPMGGGAARQFTRDGKSEHARFSPDGEKLLAVRDGQLWLFDLAGGGDPVQLTHLWGGADAGTFSADGRFIAFTSEIYPECKGPDVDACNRKRQDDHDKSQVRARISDHLFTRHWSEWKDGKRTHVFVVSASPGASAVSASPGASPASASPGASPVSASPGASPAPPPPPPRDLTPFGGDWPGFRLGGADDFDLSPDGKDLVVSHKEPAREAWSTNSDLYAIPTQGGAPKNLTAGNPGDDAAPRFSPDGRWLAWISQAREGYESDQWRLKLLDRKSGRVSVLGHGFDEDVGSFAWRRDSRGLVFSLVRDGRFYLDTMTLDGQVGFFSDAVAGNDFDLAPDGSALVVMSGMNRPPELFRLLPGGKPQRLTSLNEPQYAGIDLGAPPEDLWVQGKDGARIHSFVLRPPGLAKGERAPLTVLIHGGPQGSWEDAWGMRWNEAIFAARGRIVVAIDPHGSVGYGQKYKEEISRDWGGLAYDDILRAVDAAEARPDVEKGRTCAAGASFGGYMIDWIAGHTDRFRCLVTHDGVFDLVSEYGSTEELWFPEWEFGGPYFQNPELYRKFSPSGFVQNFKTPTLVVQGELDFRVPVEQGMGMFTALQRKGVESRLLYFPDEGHWVNKPRNSQLWYHTVLDWIDAHSKGNPG